MMSSAVCRQSIKQVTISLLDPVELILESSHTRLSVVQRQASRSTISLLVRSLSPTIAAIRASSFQNPKKNLESVSQHAILHSGKVQQSLPIAEISICTLLCSLSVRLLTYNCLLPGGIILLLFKVVGEPYKRGFFCDDQTLMYPFHSSTVTSGMLYGIGFSLGVFLVSFKWHVHMLIIEALLVFKFSKKDLHKQMDITKYGKLVVFVRDTYLSLVPFIFGAAVEHIFADIGKFSIGRLRPHFFDVCQVNFTKVDCSSGYIVDFECTGDRPDLIDEVRKSFPSGHASFSTYVAVYLIIYIQRRTTFLKHYIFRPLLQAVLLMMAWYTSLSRVMNNKHHPTDVIGGALVGAVTAFSIAYCVSDLFTLQLPRCVHGPAYCVSDLYTLQLPRCVHGLAYCVSDLFTLQPTREKECNSYRGMKSPPQGDPIDPKAHMTKFDTNL
ncbi:WUN-like protein [Mya arenaria]|uniref:WUN-like protein n=1 Tax=Mya arenaria TaxID=6604 RepID=A0ABY7DYH8_MYAAR|nr:WUN-like protein [Mya arenaria]